MEYRSKTFMPEDENGHNKLYQIAQQLRKDHKSTKISQQRFIFPTKCEPEMQIVNTIPSVIKSYPLMPMKDMVARSYEILTTVASSDIEKKCAMVALKDATIKKGPIECLKEIYSIKLFPVLIQYTESGNKTIKNYAIWCVVNILYYDTPEYDFASIAYRMNLIKIICALLDIHDEIRELAFWVYSTLALYPHEDDKDFQALIIVKTISMLQEKEVSSNVNIVDIGLLLLRNALKNPFASISSDQVYKIIGICMYYLDANICLELSLELISSILNWKDSYVKEIATKPFINRLMCFINRHVEGITKHCIILIGNFCSLDNEEIINFIVQSGFFSMAKDAIIECKDTLVLRDFIWTLNNIIDTSQKLCQMEIKEGLFDEILKRMPHLEKRTYRECLVNSEMLVTHCTEEQMQYFRNSKLVYIIANRLDCKSQNVEDLLITFAVIHNYLTKASMLNVLEEEITKFTSLGIFDKLKECADSNNMDISAKSFFVLTKFHPPTHKIEEILQCDTDNEDSYLV